MHGDSRRKLRDVPGLPVSESRITAVEKKTFSASFKLDSIDDNSSWSSHRLSRYRFSLPGRDAGVDCRACRDSRLLFYCIYRRSKQLVKATNCLFNGPKNGTWDRARSLCTGPKTEH